MATRVNRKPGAYPEELEDSFVDHGGRAIRVRPILPGDAPLLQRLFRSLSPESVHRRFFSARRQLTDEEAHDLATLDYNASLALVALPEDDPEQLLGVARTAPLDGQPDAVEMAIVVADAYQRRGIGRQLLQRLIEAARQRGRRRMLVETQGDNQPMINLARATGYPMELDREGSSLHIWLDLTRSG